MTSLSTTTRPPSFSGARRERGWWRSLRRLLGLTALGRWLRMQLFGTRRRTNASTATTAALIAVLSATAVFFPNTAPGKVIAGIPGAVTRLPGAVQQVIGTGDSQTDITKAYPRLYSRRLGVDVAIKPGDGKTPPVQPIAFQYPHTADLGRAGNTYLYAHDRPGMFAGLHNAKPGDVLVVFVTPDQRMYFQVTEIHRNVAWNDLEWLQPTKDVRLTLQTCNLSGDYDPRFIVVTRQIPAEQGRAIESA